MNKRKSKVVKYGTSSIKRLLANAVQTDMPEITKLKLQLDMAVGLILAQKMTIARLRYKLEKNRISEDWDDTDMRDCK